MQGAVRVKGNSVIWAFWDFACLTFFGTCKTPHFSYHCESKVNNGNLNLATWQCADKASLLFEACELLHNLTTQSHTAGGEILYIARKDGKIHERIQQQRFISCKM